MATYTVYYERNGKSYPTTINSNRSDPQVKKVAVNLACATSKMVPGFVTVMRNGIEVAACRNGKQVASKNPSDPLNRTRRKKRR